MRRDLNSRKQLTSLPFQDSALDHSATHPVDRKYIKLLILSGWLRVVVLCFSLNSRLYAVSGYCVLFPEIG